MDTGTTYPKLLSLAKPPHTNTQTHLNPTCIISLNPLSGTRVSCEEQHRVAVFQTGRRVTHPCGGFKVFG